MPDITTEPILDLTQTEYNEFRILRIPDIAFLVFFPELCDFFLICFYRSPPTILTRN